jgi:hypothetical protein
MRTDITDSFEDFERIAEDYFDLIPPDTDSFNLQLCNTWVYDENNKLLIFFFADEWLLEEFYETVKECPKLDESFGMDDLFEAIDRKKLTITIEGKEGGLI